MKYRSVDSLFDFEFHDSVWNFASYEAGDLVVHADLLNIHENAVQNAGDCDMEIRLARITFSGCHILTFGPGVTWETDAAGNSYPAEEMITYTGHEATDRLIHELRSPATVFFFEHVDSGIWKIGACGDEPYFDAQLSFDTVTVEWDEPERPAWYVRRARGLE